MNHMLAVSCPKCMQACIINAPQRATRLDEVIVELGGVDLDPDDDGQQQQAEERDRLAAPKEVEQRLDLALEERLDDDAEAEAMGRIGGRHKQSVK